MLIRRAPDLKTADITEELNYVNRRAFLAGLAGAGVLLSIGERAALAQGLAREAAARLARDDDPLTPYEAVTGYNNFYEFGTSKDDPAANAKNFRVRPWTVKIEGEVDKPGSYEFDDLVKPYKLEERIYRHRCVEAWTMVVPWQGFPLKDLISRVRADGPSQVRGVHDPDGSDTDAGAAEPHSPLAVCRSPADGRGDAPARPHGHRRVRQAAALIRTARRFAW